MKIILKKDFDALGFEGEIFEVARGYGRNYLIPRGIAMEATEKNINLTEVQRKSVEVKKLKAKEDAEKAKERIDAVVVTISQKAGEEEKLYGSVTTMDIAEHLERQGISIDRRKMVLERPIKTLGEFTVAVKLHPKVTGHMKVVVVPEA